VTQQNGPKLRDSRRLFHLKIVFDHPARGRVRLKEKSTERERVARGTADRTVSHRPLRFDEPDVREVDAGGSKLVKDAGASVCPVAKIDHIGWHIQHVVIL
jgi:hypothetical protein